MNSATNELPPPPHPGDRPMRFYRQIHVVALSMLILVLVIYLLREFATVLQQLFIATLLAYLILPVHFWLVQRRVPPSLSYVVIVMLFLGGSFGLGQMVYHSVADFNSNRHYYQKNAENLVQMAAGNLPPAAAAELTQFFRQEDLSLDNRMRMVQTAVGTFFGFLSQTVLVLIYLVFILAERTSMNRRLHTSFEGAGQGQRARNIITTVDQIHASIGQYLAVKTFMSLLAGVLTTLVLLLFGVDYAVFWGIIAFLFNYIPYLGSWIAVVLPVVLSLVQFENPVWALTILIVLLVIQNAIGYALEPRIAGSRLNLSPLVIILSLAFWGTLWGIVGMILAVPLVVVVKSVLENIRETKPLAAMMSNQ